MLLAIVLFFVNSSCQLGSSASFRRTTQNPTASRSSIKTSPISYTRDTSAEMLTESRLACALSVPNSKHSHWLKKPIFSCSSGNTCVGKPIHDSCNFNSECDFGMFYNEKGECVSTYDMSERCSSHESCGRDAMCVFKTTLSQYGFCTQILSLSEGSLVLPEYKA